MSRILRKNDFIEILHGSVLRSDGGDYPVANSLIELEKIDAEKPIEIELISIDEMPDNAYAVTAGKLGPVSDSGAEHLEAVSYAGGAIAALKRMVAGMDQEGKRISCLYTWEFCNCLVPYYLRICRAFGWPLLDADSSGRSVPTLGTVLTAAYGHPTSPLFMGADNGDVFMVETPDPNDTDELERIGRCLVVGLGSDLACCPPPLTKATVKECLVPQTTTSLQETGRALLKAKKEGTDPIAAVLQVVDGKFICTGTVREINWVCRNGHDFGKTTIDTETGAYTMLIQNENLALFDPSGKMILTAPDSVAMLDLKTGTGLTNSELVSGMPLALLGLHAAEPWYRIPQGLASWAGVFQNVGLQNVERTLF